MSYNQREFFSAERKFVPPKDKDIVNALIKIKDEIEEIIKYYEETQKRC